MKLSNASQPTCTSPSGEVHHVYMYITCPDIGTLLGLLCIAIILVCVCMCVCMCLLVEFLQMRMSDLDFKFCFLAFMSTLIFIFHLFHYVCYEQCVQHYRR